MASKEARALMKHNKKLLQAKHKDAQFDHTRLGNLQVMQEYQRLKLAGKWTEQLEQRWILRIRALAGDTPRRWWKSWMWRKRIAGFF
jgi:hypothetical protein